MNELSKKKENEIKSLPEMLLMLTEAVWRLGDEIEAAGIPLLTTEIRKTREELLSKLEMLSVSGIKTLPVSIPKVMKVEETEKTKKT